MAVHNTGRQGISSHLLLALLLLIGSAFAVDPGSPPAVLSSANTIYTMTASYTGVANGYNITASNVTLDCAGFSITGNNSSATYGIYSTGTNTTVKNCNINSFLHGVYFLRGHNGLIQNVTATVGMANGYGIYLGATQNTTVDGSTATHNTATTGMAYYQDGSAPIPSNNTVMNSRFTSNAGSIYNAAVRIYKGVGTRFINNTVTTNGAGHGIMLDSGSGKLVENNTVTATSTGNAIDVQDADATIKNNSITTTSSHGINIVSVANTRVDCQGMTIQGANTSSTNGVYSSGTNTTIKNCNINSFFYPVNMNAANANVTNITTVTTAGGFSYFLQAPNSSFTNSNLFGRGNPALMIKQSPNATVRNNIMNSNDDAFMLWLCNDSMIENNTITTTGGATKRGIVDYANGKGNTWANNTVTATALGFPWGIYQSNHSSYINNTIIGALSAQLLWIDAVGTWNNTFYWNNFTSTTGYYVNDLNGSNFYNTSTEGNFWYNILNGSVNITSLPPVTSAYGIVLGSQVYIGSYSSTGKYPYSNSTSLNKTFGNVVDYKVLVFISSTGTFSIYYLSNASIDGQMINCTGWFIQPFNGSAIPAAIFINYTAFMNYTNGSIAYIGSSTNMNATAINISYVKADYPTGGCALDYNVFVRMYTTAGYAQTDSTLVKNWRTISILNFVAPSGASNQGDLNMFGITMGLTVCWIFFEVLAIYLFMPKDTYDANGKPIKTSHPVFAFAAYIVGIFFFLMFLFASVDDARTLNPATGSMLLTFITPVTMLLYASLGLFMIYIFLNALIKSARLIGIKVQDWWFDGKW